MANWKGKTRGGKFGNWFFIQILKWPGRNFAYFFLNFVAFYFFVFVAKARKPIYDYFRTVHNYNKWKAVKSSFKNFYIFGQTLIDKVVLMSGTKHNFTFNFDGEQHIRRLGEKGGGLLIGAHVGNWEIAGNLLKRINTPVHIVMLEAEHEKIKSMLDEAMKEKKMSIIPIKEDFSHLFKIKEAFARGEIIAMHGDRFLEGTNTLKLDFFGRKAEFPLGPFSIAVKYKKPVCFVNAFKEGKSHYHFYADEPIMTNEVKGIKERNAKATELLELYVKNLENKITKYPLQWFNYYNFWLEN